MRNVYVLHGSEDGLIGVYGSVKRALNAAYEYVGEGAHVDFNSKYYTNIQGDSGVSVDMYKEVLQ